MANTYLSRTSGTPTNALKWTFSAWVKIASIPNDTFLLDFNTDGNNRSNIGFQEANDRFIVYEKVSGSTNQLLETTRVFRDHNAWYHIVASCDRTLATASDRTKIYINGVRETSFSTETQPTQNATGIINTGVNTLIGKYSQSGLYFDGSMTHIHFVDGTAYDASTFGETDSTSGIWKPKTAPSVTYGNNGFFLKFENSGAMGTDSSGNSNTFAVGGGTLTQNVDTPSNVFCTLNTLIPTSNITYTNGNTTMASTTYSNFPLGTLGFKTGKWYYEAKMVSTHMKFGFAEVEIPQGDPDSASVIPAYWIYGNASSVITANNHSGSNQSTRAGFTTWSANDILGLAIDLDNGKFYASLNGTWYNSADPANGTNALITSITARKSGDFVPFLGSGTSSARTNHINFGSGFFGTTAVASANADANGHGAFEYAVPSGFYAICTKNIKEFG